MKAEVKAKLADSQKLGAEVGGQLLKGKDASVDLQKRLDTVEIEHDRLLRKLVIAKLEHDIALDKILHWRLVVRPRWNK